VLNVQSIHPFRRVLDGGLILRSVASAEDAERLIAFNERSFGAGVATMSRSLLYHHPASRPDYWLFIEDAGQIVSSLCLIPWEWRYEETTLKCGEMGIVSTAGSHRNRGLIRLLDRRFKELLHAEGFHLSPIQGIPYFYRQFGYEYALPLEAQWRIELRQITTQPDAAITLRPALLTDLPALMQFQAAASQPLAIRTVRTEAVWQYLLEHTAGTATETETWLLERDGQPIGYCRIPREGFGEGLIVSETSRLDHTTAESLLGWLKTAALERRKPYIRFNLSVTSDLLQVARGYGAVDGGGYQWQLHVVEAARLLRQLTPVLERRLVNSPFTGLSQRVILNLYSSGVELDFVEGQLQSVQAIRQPDRGDINLPPNLLAPLALGYRSRAELADWSPDVRITGSAQGLVDALFPRIEAFLDTIY
jgi:predicted N-acetyltransferase YhbS